MEQSDFGAGVMLLGAPWTRMRVLLLLATMVCVGCLAEPSGGSGIHGVALVGPTCPVEQDPPDPACADKPYEGALVVTTPDGAQVVRTFSTDAAGRFNVSLPPGDYAIRSASPNALPSCMATARVVADAWTVVEVPCDSGIR